jgi:hypothetical protein
MEQWIRTRGLCTVAVAVLLVLHEGRIAAQQNKAAGTPLVGTWTLVSVDNVSPDGRRVPRHGTHPAGLLIFDEQGRYSLIILTEGTPDEYKAALEGNNADFGRYTVDEMDQSITFFMDHASHKELDGTAHKRYFTLKGGQLRYTTSRVPTDGKAGDVYGEVVLERAK